LPSGRCSGRCCSRSTWSPSGQTVRSGSLGKR
jgi:hypothetical protein